MLKFSPAVVYSSGKVQQARLFVIERIILGDYSFDSCRLIFKKYKILPASCMYLLKFAYVYIAVKENILINTKFYDHNSRIKDRLYTPSSSLNLISQGALGNKNN